MFLGLEKKLWLECHLSLWIGKEDDRREQTYFLGQTRETQSSWAFYMPFQPSPSGRARIGLGIGRPAGTGPEGGDSAHSLAGQRDIPVGRPEGYPSRRRQGPRSLARGREGGRHRKEGGRALTVEVTRRHRERVCEDDAGETIPRRRRCASEKK